MWTSCWIFWSQHGNRIIRWATVWPCECGADWGNQIKRKQLPENKGGSLTLMNINPHKRPWWMWHTRRGHWLDMKHSTLSQPGLAAGCHGLWSCYEASMFWRLVVSERRGRTGLFRLQPGVMLGWSNSSERNKSWSSVFCQLNKEFYTDSFWGVQYLQNV